MIDPACKLKSVIMEAFQNAAFLCEEYYNCAPDIEIKGGIVGYKPNHRSFLPGQTMTRNEKGKKVGLSLVYPPPHLYHILFELFKNSMRATVETHSKAKELPEIEVLLAKGEHDVSIRISDQVYYPLGNLTMTWLIQGGGIPRHITDHTFHYLVSTAPRPSMTPTKAPLAGYGIPYTQNLSPKSHVILQGYGLPLSRLYARYFHGDLILNSYDG